MYMHIIDAIIRIDAIIIGREYFFILPRYTFNILKWSPTISVIDIQQIAACYMSLLNLTRRKLRLTVLLSQE